MAISLRRALVSSKNVYHALRTASIRSHQTLSYLNSSYFDNSHEAVFVDRFQSSSATDFYQFTIRRGFAKGRKQKISTLSLSHFSLFPVLRCAFFFFFLVSYCLLISSDDMSWMKVFCFNEFEVLSFNPLFWSSMTFVIKMIITVFQIIRLCWLLRNLCFCISLRFFPP